MNQYAKSFRKIIQFTFPPERSGNPIMAHLVRKYDLNFSILQAQISPRKEGFLTLYIEGSEENWNKAHEYLVSQEIKVVAASQRLSRDEESCMHCGLCTTMCPADALINDAATRKVVFVEESCTACGMCTRVCPVQAMQVDIENTLV
jgi:ferredoxin